MGRARTASLFLLLAAGCGGRGDATLSDAERTVRVSMALRGIPPTPAERAQGTRSERALEALVDEWLDSEEFGATLRDMHAEQLAVRDDGQSANWMPALGRLEGTSMSAVNQSRADAPVRLVEEVVRSGAPYTEIVTADWMMTDRILSDAYGVPFDPAAGEWQRSEWVDGRPKAGILSSTQLWRRHGSVAQDFNRGRSNLLTKVLLCDAVSDRPLDISQVDLPLWDDPSTVANALLEIDTCVGCHQTLDPIASTFFGFKRDLPGTTIQAAFASGCGPGVVPAAPEDGFVRGNDACYPITTYHTENEDLWRSFGLRPPGFYGQPVEDLEDLGAAFAADPRFVTCSVRRFVSYFTQTSVHEVPDDVVATFEAPFRASDLDAKGLVRDIVLSQVLQRRQSTDEQWAAGLQLVRPEQLARTLRAVTGEAYLASPQALPCEPYCLGIVDLVVTEQYGYLSMLGGVDGAYNLDPVLTSTPIRSMAWSRIAAEIAQAAVQRELDRPMADRLFLTEVQGTEERGDMVLAQIEGLFEHFLHAPPDKADTEGLLALFDGEIARSGNAEDAWRLVIWALLRDPQFLHY
ncbi:MAG: hypothetical protein KTR31_16870 [Myxococcales bacterium]|nr:hypothetical protein [Myxococcales bacterium]